MNRKGYDYPSFSSSLLDSIYRSIDDELGCGAPAGESKWAPAAARTKTARGTPDRAKAVTRPQQRYHLSTTNTTSSSSDCSSYGGFSSSEPESGSIKPNRLKPIRTGNNQTRSDPKPPPIPPQPEKKKKNHQNLNSIRNKFRDLKKSRTPSSPAERLARFLNSLFTDRSHRKQKPAAAAGEESASSSASSFSRSCLAKTPSTADHGVKRSVRFDLPVDRRSSARPDESRYERREVKKMTWRDLEEEDDDVASDASSDLFELENLTANGRYRDELPVFETTHLGRLVL